MKKPLLILFFTVLNVNLLLCQKNHIGFSFALGKKSICDGLGLFAYSRIQNHFDLTFGYCTSKYAGDGYGAGVKYIPFDKGWQPYLGVSYYKRAVRNLALAMLPMQQFIKQMP